ncbi:hypothetical protein ACFV9C_43825 [Kribbella sp. NPDC059898]|uniref:hypothetical protein n=1 Tax=Kribbella sp. NPDC059898 TaxID=3346995 RepID=UPI00366039F3
MSTDVAGGRPRQTALIREHGGARTRTLDEHMFTVGATPFRLQLFTAPGLRPVALTTQFQGEGASLVQGATRFAEAIWQRCCPTELQPPIFITHQLHQSRPAQGFVQLSNPVVAHQTLAPPAQRETTLTADELTQLVGMPIDDSRGDSYVKAEPDEPAERFTVTAVVRLPRPNLEGNPACMPVGIPWWRRLGRQLVPRRSGRDCCDYHAADWAAAGSAAVRALKAARAELTSASRAKNTSIQHDELLTAVLDAIDEEQKLDAETREWARSLFFDPIRLSTLTFARYDEGRHRSQAMLDAGVRLTVVVPALPNGDET